MFFGITTALLGFIALTGHQAQAAPTPDTSAVPIAPQTVGSTARMAAIRPIAHARDHHADERGAQAHQGRAVNFGPAGGNILNSITSGSKVSGGSSKKKEDKDCTLGWLLGCDGEWFPDSKKD